MVSGSGMPSTLSIPRLRSALKGTLAVWISRPFLNITEWLHPTAWLQLFGTFATIGVLAIIFAETGLLFGCILPGDSLLFTAGILTAVSTVNGQEFQPLSLPWLLIGGPIAAIAYAQLGHWLGARYGRKLFDRPDSRIFKQEWVEKAEHYFNRFGPAKAVVLPGSSRSCGRS